MPVLHPLLGRVGWTEAAARTFGAGQQRNPSRTAVKAGAGWLGKGRDCHHGEQPSCTLCPWAEQGELILSGHEVWTRKIAEVSMVPFPTGPAQGQPLPDSLGDTFTATFCHFATWFPKLQQHPPLGWVPRWIGHPATPPVKGTGFTELQDKPVVSQGAGSVHGTRTTACKFFMGSDSRGDWKNTSASFAEVGFFLLGSMNWIRNLNWCLRALK